MENILNHRTSIFVRNNHIMVNLRFLVAIDTVISYKFSVLSLCFKVASDFYGNIPAISVIDKILKRNDYLVSLCLCICTVIGIIDRYKSYPHCRKHPLNVSPCVDILSCKPRKIFYNDTVYNTVFHILHHKFKCRTVKSCP